ncbi:FAD-dependent monooxygenase [Streptomyces sp. NPDC001843]|uniref:FAD-dependent monooxygenase n=1 Tax=Streptomyces sp. NPDC001843 TaxID=3364617 RepID=UPI00367A3C4F
MTSQTRTALVIGGGIAGSTVAMALQRAGIEATVHEAYHVTADGIGGGLSLAPNGVNALDAIGVGDVIRRVGTPMRGTVLHTADGELLGEVTLPAELPPSRFVWRGDLYRALFDEATARGIRTLHGKRLVHAEDTGDGITAHFSDGTRASADILVGTDGIRSTVRTLIDPAAPQPQYAGLLGFAAPLADTGLPGTGGKLHVSYGTGGSFGHLVHDDGSGGWFVNLPHPEPLTLAGARQTAQEQWLDTLRRAFADQCAPAADLLARTDPADLLITGPLETMPPVPTWSRGRTVLVGDAVHAASPSSGQGASQAIESAVQLARCLRDLPYEEAFAAYESLRRARVERIIALAARTNASKASPLARGPRDLKPEPLDWQFTYRIDWEAPVAADAGKAENAA